MCILNTIIIVFNSRRVESNAKGNSGECKTGASESKYNFLSHSLLIRKL